MVAAGSSVDSVVASVVDSVVDSVVASVVDSVVGAAFSPQAARLRTSASAIRIAKNFFILFSPFLAAEASAQNHSITCMSKLQVKIRQIILAIFCEIWYDRNEVI